MESQIILPSAPTYSCVSLQLLESECYVPTYAPTYDFYSQQLLESECSAPTYAPSTYDDCHSPQLFESESYVPSPTHYSPQPLESECYAPPYAPSPTKGCHSPQPLESKRFAPQPPTICRGLTLQLREGETYSPSLESYVPYIPKFKPPLTPCYKNFLWGSGPFRYTDTELKKDPSKWIGEPDLLGQIGLHGYNLHKGTNLQFVGLQDFYSSGIFSIRILLQAEDPINNSTCKLETGIWYVIGSDWDVELHVTQCMLNSPELEGCKCPEKLVVDAFYKGDMPNWMPEDALTGIYKLQYYEGKPKPLELRKVVVQTKEDVESKKKVKARNAIFYISFKRHGGQDYNAIIRRTSVCTPGFISFVAKCLK